MIQDLFQFFIDRWDFLFPLIVEHLQISMVAILFATLTGVTLGIIIAQKRKLSPVLLGIVSFLYTIPSISMLGFLIPLSGIGNTSAIIALSIYALLPIIRSTYTGIVHVDQDLLEAARGMGSTSMQILWKIKLPLALPVILSGFRNMVVMTIALAGIASFIGAGGLGVAIYRGITTNNLVMTLAGSLSVALLAVLCDLLIGALERFFCTHHHSKTSKRSVAIVLLCAMLGLCTSLYALPEKKDVIQIASKPMSEEFILTEMLKQLIEDRTNLQVQITKGVGGGTSNIHPAMVKGEFDMYPEYTGTSWNFVLKKNNIPDHDTLYKELVKEYKKKYNLVWSGLYGFNNTYGIAVTKETAQRYHLKTYDDLASVSSTMTFGAEYDYYERDDGYNALAKAMNFSFKTVDLDIGLKYDALLKKEVDAILIFTTDGRLNDKDIVVLEDRHNYFEKYYAGTVIRQEIIDQHPELVSVIALLDHQISEKDMAEMNYKVEIEKKNEADVAREFLVRKHLLEDSHE